MNRKHCPSLTLPICPDCILQAPKQQWGASTMACLQQQVSKVEKSDRTRPLDPGGLLAKSRHCLLPVDASITPPLKKMQ